MNNVICECCYVVHGWIRSCNCTHGPTRSDPENPFGLAEPWFDTSMGRNEAICFGERREMNTPGVVTGGEGQRNA